MDNLIIVDGGSTKCQWVFVSDSGASSCVTTPGVNPVLMSADQIVALLGNLDFFADPSIAKSHVFFYGAGCIPGEPTDRMRDALIRLTSSSDVHVGSDMLGAARGLLGHAPGIACILGTGCNSCLYDGENIIRNVPPLGYILGDEGSGAHIGKSLIANALKGLWPAELPDAFFEFAQADYSSIISRVYSSDRPNAYLASFASFASSHLSVPEVRNVVLSCLDDFVMRNVIPYGPKAVANGVCFTGGIAAQFERELRDVCGSRGIGVSSVVLRPIDGMVRYHSPLSNNF